MNSFARITISHLQSRTKMKVTTITQQNLAQQYLMIKN